MKTMRYNLIIVAVFLILILLPTLSNATSDPALINPNDYKPSTNTGSSSQLVKQGNVIIGLIQTVGSIISVATLITIGIKYTIAGVEQKAEYKKTMIPYIIGAVLLFASANIVSFIYDLGTQLNS
ncbi:MAG: pilin [Clostridia bacterium]